MGICLLTGSLRLAMLLGGLMMIDGYLCGLSAQVSYDHLQKRHNKLILWFVILHCSMYMYVYIYIIIYYILYYIIIYYIILYSILYVLYYIILYYIILYYIILYIYVIYI